VEKMPLNDRLISASFQCDFENVRAALEAGADVNGVDEYGQTALMLAAESLREYGKKKIIALLLDHGADVSIKDPGGWTAVDHYAMLGYDMPSGGVHDGLHQLLKAQKETLEGEP